MSYKEKFKSDIIAMVGGEKTQWENEDVWVSDSAHFEMRSEIDNSRKSYYSKFETDTDGDGSDKLYIPMIEWTVESYVKNADMDRSDILIKSPKSKPYVAAIVRSIVNHFLNKMGFGEFLNDAVRRMCIDGTVIAKTTNKYSSEYKRMMPCVRLVDPINIYIDPTAYSIQDTTIIERHIMTIDEVYRQKEWKDKDDIIFSDDSVPYTVIYERYGLIPKAWVSKGAKDTEWVDGRIVASGNPKSRLNQSSLNSQVRGSDVSHIHLVEECVGKFKPYEECWFKRVPGRWHGRGIPETLHPLNTWLNTVVNIRRDELRNKLAGKFKIRKGTGITRQMLEQIKSGGAIPVDNMDDIQELVERDIQGSAYQEPREIMSMADKVTGAFEMARGETIPSSMPATTASLQAESARTSFDLVQENLGMFIERILRRHLIPTIIKDLKEGEILRITGERNDLKAIDEFYVNNRFNNEVLKQILKTGQIPSHQDVELMETVIATDFKDMGGQRDIKILKKYFDAEYDVEVIVGNEKFDSSVMVRNLIQLIQSQLPGVNAQEMASEVLDIMGLSGSRFTVNQEEVAAPGPVNPPQKQPRVPTQQSEQQGALMGQ